MCGLQVTLCGQNLSFDVVPLNKKYIQILHINGNHWVNVSNMSTYSDRGERDRVLNLDSMISRKIGLDLKKQVCSFARPLTDTFRFDIINIMPQSNGLDCGLYAIGNATEILHGYNPIQCEYDTGVMRKHLIKCLEEGEIEQFPKMRVRRVRFGCAVKHSEEEAIHCICRMPYDQTSGDMIKCTMCHMWFHATCVNIACVNDFRYKKWFCSKCNQGWRKQIHIGQAKQNVGWRFCSKPVNCLSLLI